LLRRTLVANGTAFRDQPSAQRTAPDLRLTPLRDPAQWLGRVKSALLYTLPQRDPALRERLRDIGVPI